MTDQTRTESESGPLAIAMPPFDADKEATTEEELLPVACKECGKRFPSANSLSGHMLSHRPEVPCPECGKVYKTPGALGNHRKMAHNVSSPWSKEQEARKARNERKRERRAAAREMRLRVRGDFHADDIVSAALAILWPEGVLPVSVMIPLIEWREATQEFLEKIQSE